MSAAEQRPDLRTVRGGKAAPNGALELPPHSIEAEEACLCAALNDGDAARLAAGRLEVRDFYFRGNRLIFGAIQDLAEAGTPIDLFSVEHFLKRAETLEAAGGKAHLAAVHGAGHVVAHADYYIARVQDYGVRRRFAELGTTIPEDADTLEAIADFEEKLHHLRRDAMRGKPQQAPMTYAELMAADLPAPVYLVDKMFPQGCTLLHSVPKAGKSRLVSELAVAATTGGMFLGTFPVQKVGALCLFMEDSQPETQERFRSLTAQGPKPEHLHVSWDWDTMDRGGLERLDMFLAERPEVRLLIVDTLEYIRPPLTKDGQLYSQDVAALRKLKDLADKYQPCYVVILHHSNKSKEHSDDVILSAGGTNGIAGSCDTILQLQEKPDDTKVFRGKGRRIPPFAHVVKMDDIAGYQYLGEAATVNRSGEERDLLEALASSQWAMTEIQIAQELGCKRDAVRMRCRRAADRKLVKRSGPAQWDITPDGRIAFAEMSDGESTGVQAVRGVQPVFPVLGGSPVRGVRGEGDEAPEQAEQGAPPEQNGRIEQGEHPEHLFSSPQSDPVFVTDLSLPLGMHAEEAELRQRVWRFADTKGFPKLTLPNSMKTTGGEDWYAMWCAEGSTDDVRGVLRALEMLP